MNRSSKILNCLWSIVALIATTLGATAAFAQLQVPIPHDWTDDDHYVRSPTHPFNIGEAYDNFHLNVSYAWMFPQQSNYSLYALKDAAGGFIGLGGRRWINLAALPPVNQYATFCTQQNIPVPNLPGVTVPGVIRQAWELSPSPLGPQNLRLTVTCSGPITATLPWYVFILDNTNPAIANIVGVFKS